MSPRHLDVSLSVDGGPITLSIGDAVVGEVFDDILRQRALHLGCVQPTYKVTNTLPLGHPRLIRPHDCDPTFVLWRRHQLHPFCIYHDGQHRSDGYRWVCIGNGVVLPVVRSSCSQFGQPRSSNCLAVRMMEQSMQALRLRLLLGSTRSIGLPLSLIAENTLSLCASLSGFD